MNLHRYLALSTLCSNCGEPCAMQRAATLACPVRSPQAPNAVVGYKDPVSKDTIFQHAKGTCPMCNHIGVKLFAVLKTKPYPTKQIMCSMCIEVKHKGGNTHV